ncbi:MAG TPA: rhodanese-like domain-containing protein [Casimicrobiaceae bacterium]|nr:rhodanese-like domain-containing protein [Casimicrobiaceae bacterium]
MPISFVRWLQVAIAGAVLTFHTSSLASNLVGVDWLRQRLGSDEVVLIDASVTRLHAAKHIPGARSVDLYRYGSPHKVTAAEMEQRIQAWGISPGRKIVIYDEGASMMATWLFYELYYHGYPAEDLAILDGGLARWEAAGGAVTKEATPAPARGSFRVTQLREDQRVRLAEFVTASGDPANHALVEALEPSSHFGGTKFFDRAGHIPNAVMLPVTDFFNADKTFKTPGEIAKMAAYLGVRPDQTIHSHCGGGVAATVPYFALKFLSGFTQVKVYKESQMEWLQDERGLPMWTYDAPYLKRDATWLNGWGNRMMRMYDVAQLSVVDVRSREAYDVNHVPFALSVPEETFRRHVDAPSKLAELLGPMGVNPAHEAVIVSDGGIDKRAALAFVMLEKLGQKRVSVLMDSVDDWGLRGYPLTKEPTLVGQRKSPMDLSIPPVAYPSRVRDGVLITPANRTLGAYPKVFIASGSSVPQHAHAGKVIHVPYTELITADGKPKSAHEIWTILEKAGVPRYAEIICFADDPGEAAVNYFVLRLMGYPDVKVLAG